MMLSNSTEHSKPFMHESILSLNVHFPQKYTYHEEMLMLLGHKFATLHNRYCQSLCDLR
jgi:hypothetical protein